jgi:hypothetical protein
MLKNDNFERREINVVTCRKYLLDRKFFRENICRIGKVKIVIFAHNLDFLHKGFIAETIRVFG